MSESIDSLKDTFDEAFEQSSEEENISGSTYMYCSSYNVCTIACGGGGTMQGACYK